MSGLDDMKAALEKKLDERRAIHVERTEKESADFRAVFDAATFAEKQYSFRINRTEQIHHRRGGRAAHAKVDDRDAIGRLDRPEQVGHHGNTGRHKVAA